MFRLFFNLFAAIESCGRQHVMLILPEAIWKLHQVGGELQPHANSALCVGAEGEHVAEAALVDD